MTNRRSRILYTELSPGANFGGSHRVLFGLMSSLDRNRFSPSLLTCEAGHLTRLCEERGIPFVTNPLLGRDQTLVGRLGARLRRSMGKPSSGYGDTRLGTKRSRVVELRRPVLFLLSFNRVLRLWREVRRARVDLVHGSSPDPHLIVACRLAGVPMVAHLLKMEPVGGLDRLLSRWVGAYIAESPVCARHWIRFGLPSAKVAAVFNGIDVGQLRGARASTAQLRRELGLPESGPIVSFIARLVRWKGHIEFLEAAPAILAQRPEAQLVLVGQGDLDYTRKLHEVATEGGVEDRVVFLGHVDDLAALLHATDVSIHFPTEPETMPTILLDSMAAGRTIVSCDTEETREVVGSVAILATPKDPRSLADAVLRALALDPSERESLVRQGLERVEQLFSHRAMAQAIEPCYGALIEQGSWDPGDGEESHVESPLAS